ncbi:MAG: ABC transporter ATP-binding protein [Rhodospirillaceae bacterium]
MTGSHLELRDLVKSYDGRINAVDGIAIDIERGEFLTFLGPSGSGKTTTLMMIAGFEEPTQGAILLDGRSLSNVPPYRRNIGMVFQNYALFPHMTVARNVGFPLKMRKVSRSDTDAKVRRALSLVALEDHADKHPRELSGGQQQRVALARALVFEPDVLLLDEPLGALDKNLREYMQVEIKRIHAEIGVTTVYVTHDQTEAMTMSDRIAVFNRGRIEQIAAPLETYHRPATHFVGNFVGDSNFFDGTVTDADAGRIEIRGVGDIFAPPAAARAAGPSVHAMVRPENVRLAGDGDAMSPFDMTVDGTVNYGDSVLVIGSIGGLPLRMRLPGGSAAGIETGSHCRVGWRREDVHLISRG